MVDVMDETARRIFWGKKEAVSKLLADSKAASAKSQADSHPDGMEELRDVMSLTCKFFVVVCGYVLFGGVGLTDGFRFCVVSLFGQWRRICKTHD